MFKKKIALYNPIELIITGEEMDKMKESTNIITGKNIDPTAPTKDL